MKLANLNKKIKEKLNNFNKCSIKPFIYFIFTQVHSVFKWLLRTAGC